jgi:hypothetical protein
MIKLRTWFDKNKGWASSHLNDDGICFLCEQLNCNPIKSYEYNQVMCSNGKKTGQEEVERLFRRHRDEMENKYYTLKIWEMGS